MADDAVAVAEPVTAPAAPAAEAAPAPSVVRDATQAYARYDFPRHEPAAAPAETPTADADSGSSSTDADLTDDALDALWEKHQDRLEKRPAVQDRLARLLENKDGNRRQIDRAAIEREIREKVAQEEAAWAEAADLYYDIKHDPAIRAEKVAELSAQGQNGEALLRMWEADFELKRDAREAQRRAPKGSDPVDVEAVRSEYRESFNTQAVGEFQQAAKVLLPFYGELPEDARKTIETLKYDPEGNWLEDGLTALAKGFQKHIETLNQRHARELNEARTAGRNEAAAEDERTGPVIIEGQDTALFTTGRELDRAYAAGSISRERYHAEKKRLGINY